MKVKNKSGKKFSLKEFIWMGFNYSVGIAFIGNFAILSNIGQENSIGIHVTWLFLLEGFIAGICAIAFARMAKIHNSDNNGGSYIYVRTTFGKFWGVFIAFMQYVSLPFLITIQINSLIKGSFSPEYVGQGAWYAANWGPFTDLWLDLIGIFIYMSAATIIFLGIKWYKKIAHGSALIKWITAGCLIILGLVLAFQNGHDNMQHWTTKSEISLEGFVKAFNSCFFFFAGFEVFSTAGKNIENPEKNVGKGVVIIMAISTVFYVVITIIFFAAYSSFEQNMNMGAWSSAQPTLNKVLLYGGPIVMMISSVALKINVAMQNALYGGTTLQPLANEGFLPDKMKKLNKDNLPIKASIFNLIITGFMIFIWLCIPDIIKGVSLLNGADPVTYQDVFNVSSLTEASSVITIFIYGMVIAVALTLHFKKKNRLKIWEIILYPIVLLILAFVFVWHYYELINKIATVDAEHFSSTLTGVIIEIAFIITSMSTCTIWYFTGFKKKMAKRLIENPELQNKIDNQFRLTNNKEKLNLKNKTIKK
ncbi:hypothetical protein ESOMN_v1c03550 [Williamsoniiplasma somnilux]|uniref:Amino acid permease n=1 Tax=Williamsoniiplasma somnilux TaxID=215578 RepID=A0A2K8NY74_9MOLU|nr:APC family permease [Williamsoniiplasma somnilux]ATZ18737.1 hypothetical protein ESOMN_v1c03550 [Williamsoniiplasma somnilux]